ncbi:MAG: aminotransferase class I/II-fold pyridoxal phosphate-dependent enzyme [Peptococcaceae bacterium]|jgi:LL-diaminopimelate aminotransferase|nr:aminotransferase class I/II-fold pyridoxal phosphate-dependent enzyme [Peptococcaceae bacterium]MDH7524000.1 aminotransferase class I/II-fold pyridoxal phosphate-dependent enzyme [Peptococcaceae bacterium]
MIIADRLKRLQPGIFSKISMLKDQVKAAGKDVIDLSVGSPDMPPPPHVKEVLLKAVNDDKNYGYTLTEGIPPLKEAITGWYKKNYGVSLDPDREVLSLMGSQDGLSHIFWATVDPGDIVLVPDPGYPIYSSGPLLAGAELYPMPLAENNGYLPDFSRIPETVRRKAKVMVINYPSNPLAATATREFFQEAVSFALENGIIVCHDFAYSELSYDGFKNVSFMEIEGAKEVGVEFHSISKTFNLAGCRLGFIVGNEEVIDALRLVKSNIDYGIFRPVQMAAAAALSGSNECVRQNALAYQRRRDTLLDELAKYGWNVNKPRASMFVWAKLPPSFTSAGDFSSRLLTEKGVAVVPGTAFGECGEGYVRIGLVQEQARLKEAGKRMGEFISTV